MVTLAWMLLLIAAPMTGVCRAGEVAVSTADIRTDLDAIRVLALKSGLLTGKEVQDHVFDGNGHGGAGTDPAPAVRLNFSIPPATELAAAAAREVAKLTKAPPPPPENKRLGEIIEESGGTFLVANGSMYRIARTAPAWKFWDNSSAVEKSVPDAEGALWDKKGEFVGSWRKVVKSDAGKFQVGKGADGQDHVYITYNNATVFLLSDAETRAEYDRISPKPENRPWYYKKLGVLPRGWVNDNEVYLNAEGLYAGKRDYQLVIDHEVGHIEGRDHEPAGLMSDNGLVRDLTTFTEE